MSILEEKFKTEFLKMAESNRKISNPQELKGDVDYIFDAIEYFNAFDEYSTCLDDTARTEFDKVPILNEFKDFILPRSVRFEPSNLRTRDLLVRSEVELNDDGEVVSPIIIKSNPKFRFVMKDYMKKIDDFRRHFKRDAKSDFIYLSELKKHVSFQDVLGMTYVTVIYSEGEGKNKKETKYNYLKSGVDSIIPIKLIDGIEIFFEDSYFDSDYDTCVYNYMHKLIF